MLFKLFFIISGLCSLNGKRIASISELFYNSSIKTCSEKSITISSFQAMTLQFTKLHHVTCASLRIWQCETKTLSVEHYDRRRSKFLVKFHQEKDHFFS